MLGATLVGSGRPAPAAAQTGWRDQVARQISTHSLVSGGGYTVSHGTFYDLAERGSRKSLRITLEEGRSYRVVGRCDDDCSDLDFRLYDDNERLVASDVGPDDVPVVAVTPRRTATFRLEVDMPGCSTQLCGWGVVVLALNASGGAPTTGVDFASLRSAPPAPTTTAPWYNQVRNQLANSNLIRGYRNDGYAESHATFYDLVESGGRRSKTLRLDAGRSYKMVGKCDNDCSDLDFRLYDENGRLVASDVESDDTPVVAVTPTQTAAFRLEVTMASCSARSCAWGASVLAR